MGRAVSPDHAGGAGVGREIALTAVLIGCAWTLEFAATRADVETIVTPDGLFVSLADALAGVRAPVGRAGAVAGAIDRTARHAGREVGGTASAVRQWAGEVRTGVVPDPRRGEVDHDALAVPRNYVVVPAGIIESAPVLVEAIVARRALALRAANERSIFGIDDNDAAQRRHAGAERKQGDNGEGLHPISPLTG
jgi:hypothetical protein